jgi:hypothetical protein
MLQGVTRVDDPVASIDLCQEAESRQQQLQHVEAAVAGMIPVLKKIMSALQDHLDIDIEGTEYEQRSFCHVQGHQE